MSLSSRFKNSIDSIIFCTWDHPAAVMAVFVHDTKSGTPLEKFLSGIILPFYAIWSIISFPAFFILGASFGAYYDESLGSNHLGYDEFMHISKNGLVEISGETAEELRTNSHVAE